jgi:hypothetical protein
MFFLLLIHRRLSGRKKREERKRKNLTNFYTFDFPFPVFPFLKMGTPWTPEDQLVKRSLIGSIFGVANRLRSAPRSTASSEHSGESLLIGILNILLIFQVILRDSSPAAQVSFTSPSFPTSLCRNHRLHSFNHRPANSIASNLTEYRQYLQMSINHNISPAASHRRLLATNHRRPLPWASSWTANWI